MLLGSIALRAARPPLHLPFRRVIQGLEMHGTTILCVRKNGKVVSPLFVLL